MRQRCSSRQQLQSLSFGRRGCGTPISFALRMADKLFGLHKWLSGFWIYAKERMPPGHGMQGGGWRDVGWRVSPDMLHENRKGRNTLHPPVSTFFLGR